MNRVDVSQLRDEQLAHGDFPAKLQTDFRLYLAPAVRQGIEQHAKADTNVEICGIMVGSWKHDIHGPYAMVTDYIRCDSASSKLAEVTFTHESWAQINREMDTRFADQRIVGWYHSHPNFGIFLSDRDCFIHEHFFSGPGQVAYVIDPVRNLEGVFAWKEGRPEPLSHFWVGDAIHTVEASQARPPTDRSPLPSAPKSLSAPTEPPRERAVLSVASMLLGWIAIFFLGYLWSRSQMAWEKEMIVQGAVAHYGVHKIMRVGLKQDLATVIQRISAIKEQFSELSIAPASDDKSTKTTPASRAKDSPTPSQRKKLLEDNLVLCQRGLQVISDRYSHSDSELAALATLEAEKAAELDRSRKPDGSKD